MKTKLVRLLKVICFCILFFVILAFLTALFKPKWLENRWQSAKTNNSFYELEDDSIDVAIIGSSVVAAAVDPFQLYEEYGISAYNMGVMQQPMLGTYYWLQEILKTQHPKVVVVEVKTAGRVSDKNEADARKSYDYMRFGKNKIEYAIDYCKTNEEAELFEYLFPFGKYHTRWSELTADDYNFVAGNNKSLTRGFATLTTVSDVEFNGFDINKDSKDKEFNETNSEYLKKIIETCKNNNIEVVLVKTADSSWNVKKYKFVKKIADEYSVDYIDFNDSRIISATGMDLSKELADSVHLNLEGAKKTTSYLGGYLASKYNLTDYRNEAGKVSDGLKKEYETYKYVYEDAKLCMENNLAEYLNKINTDYYTVVVASGGTFRGVLTDEQNDAFKALGMSEDTLNTVSSGNTIISIMDNNTEKLAKTLVSEDGGSISDKGYIGDEVLYSLNAGGTGAAINIGTKDYALACWSVCIAVFDERTNEVADSIYLSVGSDGKVTLGR